MKNIINNPNGVIKLNTVIHIDSFSSSNLIIKFFILKNSFQGLWGRRGSRPGCYDALLRALNSFIRAFTLSGVGCGLFFG